MLLLLFTPYKSDFNNNLMATSFDFVDLYDTSLAVKGVTKKYQEFLLSFGKIETWNVEPYE